jgi:RNA polymerase sigma factor (sigma-70 family)
MERLYRAHFPALMRVAFALTGSNEVAEDVVQDAFLRCAGRLDNVLEPAAYLRAAVVNGCRSYHRRLSTVRRLANPLGPSGRDLPGEVIELRDALLALSMRRRTAVVLRYLCDFDDREIAVALGCRQATVRSLLRRGLTQLREAIT